jgi:type III restriction enzyme
MIVDEAHNAVTRLSREMQGRINPCAIIEFTATPRDRSNILHNVTAQELKAAELIKLPIILAEHDSWQTAVNGAIASRAALAEAAKDEAEYIRPIVLFRTQNKNQEVTVEVLKKHLMEVEQIPEDYIAIATGDQRGLDSIDLFDPQCRIEYVITIEALKEGWDCSFAHVFCSVSRIQSATAVEQLLGRVLRMPYARRRKTEALNRAYAHISEPSFGAAANALVDKLVAMGFDEEEAKDAIVPAQADLDETGLFGPREREVPVFRHTVALGFAGNRRRCLHRRQERRCGRNRRNRTGRTGGRGGAPRGTCQAVPAIFIRARSSCRNFVREWFPLPSWHVPRREEISWWTLETRQAFFGTGQCARIQRDRRRRGISMCDGDR